MKNDQHTLEPTSAGQRRDASDDIGGTVETDSTHETESTGQVVRWGDGDAIPGTPFRQVVTGDVTDGCVVAIAADMPPGLHVDEHTHSDEDQITIVIRGRVGASVGDQLHVIEEGGVLFMPRGVPHALWNLGDEEAHLLDLYTPSGIEHVFAAAGAHGGTPVA